MAAKVDSFPHKTVPMTADGIKTLLKSFKGKPTVAADAAALLESNPKALLDQLFRLSDTQLAAIRNTPDADLKQRVAPMVTALKAGASETASPETLKFDPGVKDSGGGPTSDIKCYCYIEWATSGPVDR